MLFILKSINQHINWTPAMSQSPALKEPKFSKQANSFCRWRQWSSKSLSVPSTVNQLVRSEPGWNLIWLWGLCPLYNAGLSCIAYSFSVDVYVISGKEIVWKKYIYKLLRSVMASHSSTLAWKIPWTEEPGRLQSSGSWRVGNDWAPSLSLFTFMHWIQSASIKNSVC